MANPVVTFSVSEVYGALIVVGLCLAAVFFVLLVVLVISLNRRKYYARIRLGSPRLDAPGRKRVSSALRTFARIAMILLILAAAAFVLFYLARLGMGLVSSIAAPGQENLSAEPESEAGEGLPEEPALIEPPAEEVNTEEPAIELVPEEPQPAAAAGIPFLEKIRDFAVTYAGYVILGFIILIILISVLGSRKEG